MKMQLNMSPETIGLALALALFTVAGAQAAGPWYVATNGVDNSDAGRGLSWSLPYATISNAIAKAGTVANEIIWVSNGVYTLTATVNNPVAKACRIRAASTNPADTVLLGPGTNANFRGVSMYGAGSELQGFTVTNFYSSSHGAGVFCNAGVVSNCIIAGNILKNTAVNTYGGGMYLTNGVADNCDIIWNTATTLQWISGGGGIAIFYASRINNCRITGNSANMSGGGVFLNGSLDNTIIQNSTVASNNCHYYGGGILAFGAGTISNCMVVSNNCPYGGGISVRTISTDKRIKIEQCVVSNNYASYMAGGGYVASTTNAMISRCQFVNNSCNNHGGGGLLLNGTENTLVQNCLITGNSATNSQGGVGGAGIYVVTNNVLIENCTITSNTLVNKITSKGGGLYAPKTGVIVVNSIIYYNQHAGSTSSNYYVSAGTTFSNSCTAPTNGLTGTANTEANPQFVAKESGNFHLLSGSPCINAGLVQDWMRAAQDLDGRPRLDRFSGQVDMGCYEYIPRGALFGGR